MAKTATLFAGIKSENEFELGFPYKGSQRAELVLRTSAKYSKDVMLQIERGQMICGFPSCSVLVRWDDADAVKYIASRSSDGDAKVLFINNYSGFLQKLGKARRVAIQPTIYQSGDIPMLFNVAGFNAAKYAGREK